MGTVSLFGLRRASLRDDHHAGSGLTFELDITDFIDNLFHENSAEGIAAFFEKRLPRFR